VNFARVSSRAKRCRQQLTPVGTGLSGNVAPQELIPGFFMLPEKAFILARPGTADDAPETASEIRSL